MYKHKTHPVRNYLKNLKWDGVKRAETLFIDFLGAENSQYVKDVTRTWLKAAVARIERPGVKYDSCIVLSGPQGIGKSTILSRLGGKWFNDSIVSFQGKEAMEQLQGSWIIELSEMQASTKADNDMIKAFLSRQTDKFRAPYGRRTEEYPRQCVFAATTNDSIFLKDRTGGRRFLPVFCAGNGKRPLSDLTDDFIGQVWAEVKQIYEADQKLYLPADSAKTARELQEAHTEGGEKLGLVLEYLKIPLPANWGDMDIYDRRDYIKHHGEEGYPEGMMTRNRVCALEIWCEVFDGTRQGFRNADAREMNGILQQLKGWTEYKDSQGKLRFGNLYGPQRAFIRKKKE